jgi:hypothetical protein
MNDLERALAGVCAEVLDDRRLPVEMPIHVALSEHGRGCRVNIRIKMRDPADVDAARAALLARFGPDDVARVDIS